MNKMLHTLSGSRKVAGVMFAMLLFGGGAAAQVTIGGSVYGGGALANVGGAAQVDILGGTVSGSVYGGGLGQTTPTPIEALVAGDATVNIGSAEQTTPTTVTEGGVEVTYYNSVQIGGYVFGANNLNGTPQGDVTVNIYHTKHNAANMVPNVTTVAALEALRPTTWTDGTADDDQFALKGVYGGGNLANYVPTNATKLAQVNVIGCENTIDFVYGGGKAADGESTKVNIYGGHIDTVFAGGDGSEPGTEANLAGDVAANIYGGLMGAVFGGSNTSGEISGSMSVNIDNNGGCIMLIVGSLFGGGNLAPTNQDAGLEIACPGAGIARPEFGQIYGGGNKADVNGNVQLTIRGGSYDNVFGGNNQTGTITGNVVLNLNGGTISNAFGGNNAGGNILGNITVNVVDDESQRCPLRITNIYGGGKDAAYEPTDQTAASPAVNVKHLKDYGGTANSVKGNVFGGGYGITATVTANPVVTIGDITSGHESYVATVDGNVYGGGELASVVGNTTVTIQKSNTYVEDNVFGAGKGSDTDTAAALVNGNATVNITGGHVGNNVYGGGEMSSVGDFVFRTAAELAVPATSDIGTGTNHATRGKTTVNISGGQIGTDEYDNTVTKSDGYVFGGGLGKAGHNYMHHAFVRTTEVNISSNAFITASVFGGAENGHVYGDTKVSMSGGQVGQEISPAQYMTEDAGTGVSRWLYFGNVYGGGRGVERTLVPDTLTAAEIEGLTLGTDYRSPEEGVYIRIKSDGTDELVDGDYSATAGRVRGNTVVDISAGRVVRNVYGGGSLASVGMDDALTTNGKATVTIRGNAVIGLPDVADFATTTHLSDLKFKDINNTEYAIGATLPDSVKSTADGISTFEDLYFYLFAGHNSGRVFGSGRGAPGSEYAQLANVKNTAVTVTGSAKVRGSVFGGGENGHVRQDTKVSITGGQVGIEPKGDVLRRWTVKNFSGKKDKNGTLLVNDTLTWGDHWMQDNGVGPTVFRGNVYGGGRGVDTVTVTSKTARYSLSAGRVYGNTNVVVSGGTVWHDVYGGGSLASVGDTAHQSGSKFYDSFTNELSGNATMKVPPTTKRIYDIADTHWVDSSYAYRSGTPVNGTGTATVTICGGTVGLDGINNGAVYGSGRGIAGDKTHNFEATNLAYAHNTQVYIQGANGTDSDNDSTGTLGAAVKGCVFGGGANGHVTRNSFVKMTGGTVGVPLPFASRKVDPATGHGVRVYRGNVYAGGRGVDPVEGASHLSMTAGRVFGNSKVEVSAGKVYHSVFGGGSLASVGTFVLDTINKTAYNAYLDSLDKFNKGNTAFEPQVEITPDVKHYYIRGTGMAVVTVNGTAHIGHDWRDLENVTVADAEREIGSLVSASTWSGMTDDQKKKALIDSNYLYLGSNSGMVFGSGRGVAALHDGTFDRDYAEAAFTNNTIVTIGGTAMVCGSVFGGGENGHVKRNTLVTIESSSVIGGIPLHNDSYHTDADGFSENTDIVLDFTYEDSEDESGVGPVVYRGNVYGGGRGVDHYGSNAVQGFSATAGRVYGNTRVNVTGGKVYHHVFGGGSIASVGTYDTAANGTPLKAKVIYGYKHNNGNCRQVSVTAGDTLQSKSGDIRVDISGGQIGVTGHNEGSVFGGGRGIAGSRTTEVTHLAYANHTNVNILPGAVISGCVFGGGANGHVLDSTYVHMTGGIVGTPFEMRDTLTTPYGYAPHNIFRGNVYGGGRGVDPSDASRMSRTAGRVYGNTHVLIEDGWVRHSVYGGGSMASVGNYELYDADGEGYKKNDIRSLQWINPGATDDAAATTMLWRTASTADKATIESHSGRAWVEITGGWIGSRASGTTYTDTYTSYPAAYATGQGGEGRNNGRVFGSCRGTAGDGYDSLAYVNLTRVIIGKLSDHTGPIIKGNVFGSGENGHVFDSTYVQMHGGEIGHGKINDWKRTYIGNLYGGGRGVDFSHSNSRPSPTAGWVHNSTRVEMTGGTVWHNVYGGGSLASVGDTNKVGYENIDSTSKVGRAHVLITGGRVGYDGDYNGNVFGSGRGRAGKNVDIVFRTECPGSCTDNTVSGADYKVLKKVGSSVDSLYFRRIYKVVRAGVSAGQDSIFVLQKRVAGVPQYGQDSTVTNDYSQMTYVINSIVTIRYADSIYNGNNQYDTVYRGRENNRICGSVYGSGDNGHVHHNSYVYFHRGIVGTRPSTAVSGKSVSHGTVTTGTGTWEAFDTIVEGVTYAMVPTSGSVYGSGRGMDLSGVTNQYSPSAGRTWGNSYVKVTGGKVLRNVYGGGNMASVGQIDTVWVDDDDHSAGISSITIPTGRGTAQVLVTGGVIGETYNVQTPSRYSGGNVFGSSRGLSSDVELVRNMAIVNRTDVTIGSGTSKVAVVRGSVFGGGENGHVYTDTRVMIRQGAKIGHETRTYSGTVYHGNVYGGGRGVDITQGGAVDRLSGAVYGNTTVYMTGGAVYHNVHGGGSVASVGRYAFNDGTVATSPDDSVLYYATGLPTGIKKGGRTSVLITGGTVGINADNNGRVFGAGRGIAGTDSTGNAFNYYTFVDSTEVIIDSAAQINGCVFGSGDNGHMTGSAHVIVRQSYTVSGGKPVIGYNKGGPSNGNVFGSGRGAERGKRTSADANPYYYSKTAGLVRGNTKVDILAGTIKNNVYGGGFMASVVGNTEVNIGAEGGYPEDLVIYGDVFGGSALGEIGTTGKTTTINVLSGTIGETDASKAYNAGKKGNVFGGGNGDAGASGDVKEAVTVYVDGTENTTVDHRPANVLNTVQVNIGTSLSKGNATVKGFVFGGNNIDGCPKGNINVDIWKTYHDSDNEMPAAPAMAAMPTDELDSADVTALIYSAGVVNEAKFALKAVYGGGNQAEYATDLANAMTHVTIHGCMNTIKYVYGGGKAADTKANKVDVEGGLIYQVYGGGDGSAAGTEANVAGNAITNIYGGLIDGVFGGSNTSGVVNGEARVTVKDSAAVSCNRVINEVFGGGNEAPGGAVVVTIPCGIEGLKDVYGGAKNADIGTSINHKNIHLVINGGDMQRVFGGNMSGGTVYGNVTVDVYGSNPDHTIDEVFGGSNLGGSIMGDIIVNIDSSIAGCPLKVNNVYGGGNQVAYAPTDPTVQMPEVNLINGSVLQDVFGGGKGFENLTPVAYAKRPLTQTEWEAADPALPAWDAAHQTLYDDSLALYDAYAEYVTKVNCAKVTANPYVNIGSDAGNNSFRVWGNVYGGGKAAPVDGSTVVKLSSSTGHPVTIGTTADVTDMGVNPTGNGNVFGGGLGSTATVTGNTSVGIFGNKTTIYHNVYGGGSAGIVQGSTDVQIGASAAFSTAMPTLTATGDAMITLGCTTPGTTIRYNVGAAPEDPTASTGTEYTAPFQAEANNVVKAIAVREGYSNSAVATMTVPIPTPTVSGDGSTVTVTLGTHGPSDATIHYTTNNETPTTSSPTTTGSISVSSGEVVKVIAAKEGYITSAVAGAQVATPTITISGGNATVSCTTPGATLRYTIGDSPNNPLPWVTATTVASGGTVAIAAGQTIRVIADLPGYEPSIVAEAKRPE